MFAYAEQTLPESLAWVALCQASEAHTTGGMQQEINLIHIYETRQSR